MKTNCPFPYYFLILLRRRCRLFFSFFDARTGRGASGGETGEREIRSTYSWETSFYKVREERDFLSSFFPSAFSASFSSSSSFVCVPGNISPFIRKLKSL